MPQLKRGVFWFSRERSIKLRIITIDEQKVEDLPLPLLRLRTLTPFLPPHYSFYFPAFSSDTLPISCLRALPFLRLIAAFVRIAANLHQLRDPATVAQGSGKFSFSARGFCFVGELQFLRYWLNRRLLSWVSLLASMSLRVDDPRSRGRSKSPSGRTRDRSTSRDPRLPSPGPEPSRKSAYLSADPAGEKVRTRSRSRGASPLRSYRKPSRYDSDSEHDARDYARRRPERDYYYHSDSDDSRGAPKRSSQRYSRPPPERRSGQISRHSDEDDIYSSDDDLAYGDAGGLERGYYGHKSSSSISGPPPLMTGALNNPSAGPRSSAEAVSGYSRYGAGQPAYSGPPHTQPTWAPVPDCEKPGFVPPASQGGDSMPGAFPAAMSGPPPTAQYMSPDSAHSPYAPWNAPTVTSGAPYAAPVTTASHQRNPPGDPNLYANPPAFQYAQIDPNVRYSTKPTTGSTYSSRTEPLPSGVKYSATPQYSTGSTSGADTGPQYIEVAPSSRTSGRPSSLSVSTGNSLGVGGGHDTSHPPASPLLEA